MSEHTPGPWTVNDEGNVCLPSSADMIAWTTSPDDMEVFGESPETLANARLIAAAPELLAAVRALLRFNEELCTDIGVSKRYPSAEQARAAIAKAEGRADDETGRG